MKPLTTKIFTLVAYAVIVGAIFLSLLFGYWNLQNPTVLVLKNAPFPVRPDTNIPGQVEYMHVAYCKTFKTSGMVLARMVGQKSIIRIPWPNDDSSPQCVDSEIPIVIPTYAVDDTYYFEFTVNYQVNPLKTVTVDLKSQTFMIAAKPVITP